MVNIINSDEKAKNLGFVDVSEMLLYYDVCCFDIVPPQSLEELLENLQGETESPSTKSDFEEYIEKNNLLELFEKVKGLSLLNRMLEIYMYNANGFSISDKIEKLFEKKIQEASELYNGELEIEYKQKKRKIKIFKQEYFERMQYIERQSIERLTPEEKTILFGTISDVSKSILPDDFEFKNRGLK